MKILASRDPNVFSVRTGGGCLTLFGLPFLLSGLGVMLMPLASGQGVEALGAVPFGLIFGLVGAGLVFGRGGIDADRRRGEVRRWWSVIVRLKTQTTPLGEVSRVRLTREVRRSKNSTYTVYPVYLDARTQVKLVEDQDYQMSRAVAEGMARFAGAPMTDSSGATEVTRQPDELNECLRDRARRLNERVEWPSPPPVSALVVRQEPEGLAIECPRAGLSFMTLLPAIIYGGIAVFFILPLLATVMLDSHMQASEKLIGGLVMFGVFGVIPGGLIGFSVMKSATRRVRVVVDGRRLRVEERHFAGSKTTEFPAEELEELIVGSMSREQSEAMRQISGGPAVQVRLVTRIMRLVNPTGITARSDKHSLTFGENLTAEDQGYLYALIRAALIG